MLGKNLIALRSLKGLSQEQLAESIGVSRQAYAKWEKGTALPDVTHLLVLAELYGTTVEELMCERKTDGGTPVMPAPKGKHIWGSVTLNDRGQIVIPKAARDIFGLKSGDRLVVGGAEGEGIVLWKAEAFENMMQDIMTRASKKAD